MEMVGKQSQIQKFKKQGNKREKRWDPDQMEHALGFKQFQPPGAGFMKPSQVKLHCTKYNCSLTIAYYKCTYERP